MNLLTTEMRRALHRRAVRVLIAIAPVGCAVAGVIAYFGSAGKTLLELQRTEDSPAVMTNWWVAADHVGVLSIGKFFLLLGGFFAGATVARGRRRWLLPIVLVVVFPFTVFVLVFATLVLSVWLIVREQRLVEQLRSSMASGVLVRVAWFAVAALGAVAVVNDVAAIAERN